jgi:V8-like Glu-specific endopeptidase
MSTASAISPFAMQVWGSGFGRDRTRASGADRAALESLRTKRRTAIYAAATVVAMLPSVAQAADLVPHADPTPVIAEHPLRKVSTFEHDNRRDVDDSLDECASAVGRIETEDEIGTGSVVLNPQIVVTNLHVVRENGRAADRVLFQLQYRMGAGYPIRGTVVAYGSDAAGQQRKDWAIVVLDAPAPTRPLALGIYSATQLRNLGPVLSLIGYSGDLWDAEVASIAERCSIDGVDSGLFTHNCPMMKGASGGPILAPYNGDWCAMVALNEGALGDSRAGLHYSRATANIAVMPSEFKDALLEVLARVRSGWEPARAKAGWRK